MAMKFGHEDNELCKKYTFDFRAKRSKREKEEKEVFHFILQIKGRPKYLKIFRNISFPPFSFDLLAQNFLFLLFAKLLPLLK
jgi:hypothetical protein